MTFSGNVNLIVWIEKFYGFKTFPDWFDNYVEVEALFIGWFIMIIVNSFTIAAFHRQYKDDDTPPYIHQISIVVADMLSSTFSLLYQICDSLKIVYNWPIRYTYWWWYAAASIQPTAAGLLISEQILLVTA